MANYRPAGFSDEDSESDDYDYEKPPRRYYQYQQQENYKKKIEINLQDAIINGSLKETEKIINCDLQGNVDSRLENGWTPLMHACFHAQNKIVDYLLTNGADPNLHSDSVNPLMLACSNSSANEDVIDDIVKNLIEKNCILNTGDRYGQTPLMRAIASGRTQIVQRLLDSKVNFEMRDQQGWTAVFWAVHHNKPEILNLLIEYGARLFEVDRSNRSLADIAESHDYQNIIEILQKYIKKDDDESFYFNNEVPSWHDFYPGIEKDHKSDYKSEIPNLLYGMNCERLTPIIMKTDMTLRTFLLLEESDMINLGIELPFERQRLMHGLQNFLLRKWKLNAVAGLYARKVENYSVLDCLTTLGSHLQQVYILEATLQYILREYSRIQNQLKYEPPDSPTIIKIKNAAKNMKNKINCIRRELNTMKKMLTKISKRNAPPADLIKGRSVKDKALGYLYEFVKFGSFAFLIYNTRSVVNIFRK